MILILERHGPCAGNHGCEFAAPVERHIQKSFLQCITNVGAVTFGSRSLTSMLPVAVFDLTGIDPIQGGTIDMCSWSESKPKGHQRSLTCYTLSPESSTEFRASGWEASPNAVLCRRG